jgi:hypothetical protein
MIHDGEAADGYGADFRNSFEPLFDPSFAVTWPIAEHEREAHTAGNAVLPGLARFERPLTTSA